MSAADPHSILDVTALNALHRDLGAKLVPFAGYEMPLQYAPGIVKEHLQVRENAGLFDVSHMGQARLEGADFNTIATALETIVAGDILGLKPGRVRYTQLLNDEGGIIDDLMVARPHQGNGLNLVVNASRKQVDYAFLKERLPPSIELIPNTTHALLALQGPKAVQVFEQYSVDATKLSFMKCLAIDTKYGLLSLSRSGYTGEDGFEISVPGHKAEDFARALLADERVLPIGLGARDTLRLEAGLPLYGQDMDETISPVEANLTFSIGKRRQREQNFIGASRIMKDFSSPTIKTRIGIKLEGRAAARTGMQVADESGAIIGHVTSGAFTPSAGASVAMAYIPQSYAQTSKPIFVVLRGTSIPAQIVPFPFVPHRYVRNF